MKTDTDLKFTRADYLTRRCNHREYYGQFIDQPVLDQLRVTLAKVDPEIHMVWVVSKVGLGLVRADLVKGISAADLLLITREAVCQIEEGRA